MIILDHVISNLILVHCYMFVMHTSNVIIRNNGENNLSYGSNDSN